jgi:hypothetical protein
MSGQALPADRGMAKVQAKADLLLALYSHASDDLERMRAEADHLRSRAADDLGRARAEADSLRRELADVRREFSGAHKEMGRLQRELAETRHERDLLTQRSAQLQQQHEALLASTSWRVTAPIRVAARAMKRQ